MSAIDADLRAAARAADTDTFMRLIDAGADPTTRDENGAVALMHAAAGNAVDVVRYLLGEGVAWNDVDDDGDCAGQYASGHVGAGGGGEADGGDGGEAGGESGERRVSGDAGAIRWRG